MNKLEKLIFDIFHPRTPEQMWLDEVKEDYDNRIIKGNPVVDFEMGVGYYITLGILFGDPYKDNAKKEFKMKSGKRAYAKLLKYKAFHDPDDMVESSEWQFLGYVGEKLLQDMSFEEYCQFCRDNMTQGESNG